MIVCQPEGDRWVARHRTIPRVFATGYCRDSALRKAKAKLFHFERATQRVKLSKGVRHG